MSALETHQINLGKGDAPTGHFSLTNNGPDIEATRGKVGGGNEVALRLRQDGGLEVPQAPVLPVKPEEAVIARVLAAMMPKVIPVSPGKRSFSKQGPKAVSVKAGTVLFVGGVPKGYSADTAVVMPDVMTPGEDYSIWVLPSGALFAAKDGYNAPYAPTPAQAGATKVGGFHYGLVAEAETLVGGSFNTATKASLDMVWQQSDLDKLAGINAHSLWDEAFRPTCDPRGMSCVTTSVGEGLFWFDIYFTGTEHITNGTSRAGTDVASGTVLPKIPAMFGGNGTAKYTTFNWYEASEIALSHGKRLLSSQEFAAAAFGVTEAQSLGGSSVSIPATSRQAGYTSKWGGEQMTGHHITMGASLHGVAGTAWVSGAVRGQTYGTPYVAFFGGHRVIAASSGSRCSNWDVTAWSSGWNISLRAACDHKRPR